MKRTLLSAIVAAVALTSVAGSPAMAQGWGPDHREPDRYEREHGGPRGPEPRPVERRIEERRVEHRWHPGERLDRRVYTERVVITRPATHHLHPAPRGHRWVRVGSDAILVVATTGLVVEVAPGIFR